MSDDNRMDRARRIRQMREGDEDRPDEQAGDDESVTRQDDATGGDGAADDGDDELEMEWGDPGPSAAAGSEAGRATESGPGDQAAGSGAETAGERSSTEADDGQAEPETESISAPLPGTDQLEDALEGSGASPEAETVAPDAGEEASSADAEEETRVLEFTLADEHYCLDIEYIEEIVKEETVTRVPNTPDFVEGVVDLRGQITTILNPKVTIDKDDTAAGELIVVFDGEAFEDQGHVGWVVDDVRQVSLVTESAVNQAPMEQDHVNGVIDRDGDEKFVIWTTPELVVGKAA